MNERETVEQASSWLVGTFTRNPEALLVLAAGCALLMRSKGGGNGAPHHDAPRHDASRNGDHYYDAATRPRPQDATPGGTIGRAAESARHYASDVAGAAGQYAKEAVGGVTDAAGRYASTISGYAGDVRDAVKSGVSHFPDQARSTMQQGFARILREQPLAVAAMGVAAGAAMAAIFPVSETESKVLSPAHDAVVDAASRAAETVKVAVGEAGEQLKQAAHDRGLDGDALKGLAREVAGNFADNVAGRSNEQNPHKAPTLVPENVGNGGRP